MPFNDFVDKIAGGNLLHYMTTQNLIIDEEGQPKIFGSPVTQLQGDFPLRPQLMGNLVPFNINMWFGNSVNGASTGLHHDFHDNLYVLLRGRKRFRLYSPADAEKLYVRGSLACVHPNGRICYAGEVTNADGTDKQADAAAKAAREHAAAEAEVAAAEAAVSAGAQGSAARLAAAEERLDLALDTVLSAQMGGSDEEGNGSGEDSEEGFDFLNGGDEGDSCEDSEEGFDCLKGGAADSGEDSGEGFDFSKCGDSGEDSGEGFDFSKCGDKDTGTASNDGSGAGSGAGSSGTSVAAGSGARCRLPFTTPLNFSQIQEGFPMAETVAEFPRYADEVGVDVEVRAGEMLYLPAGWFHNVTSFTDADAPSPPCCPTSKQGGHLAFNYWFHPPDVTDPQQFSAPYKSGFWPLEWQRRLDEGEFEN